MMEVPVVKIRGGEPGGEEKLMIKSIVNMVQYLSVCVTDQLTLDGTLGKCCMILIHTRYSWAGQYIHI